MLHIIHQKIFIALTLLLTLTGLLFLQSPFAGHDIVLAKESPLSPAEPFNLLDSDSDGLNDDDEINIHYTDPNNRDTDGDELSDGFEVNAGSEPDDANDIPGIIYVGNPSVWGDFPGDGSSWEEKLQSIQAAIDLADASPTAKIIWVASGTYYEDITLASGVALFGGFEWGDTLMSQRDPANNETIIDARGENAACVTMDSAEYLHLEGFTLTGDNAGVNASTTDYTCTILNCTTDSWISLSESSLIVRGCTLNGAGISLNSSSSIDISECTINTPEGSGLNLWSSSATVTNCTFDGGGTSEDLGIYTESTSFIDITDSTIKNYLAAGLGLRNSLATITNCTISGNEDSGMYIEYTSLNINQSTISNNKRTYSSAGGLACYNSNLVMNDCVITNNTADITGGGLHIANGDDELAVELNNCTIVGNKSLYDSGGGVNSYSNNITFTNCIISGNYAYYSGGGLLLGGSVVSMINCTVSNNEAPMAGGIHLLGPNSATFSNTIFDNNTQGIYEEYTGTDVGLNNCLFNNNTDGDYYDSETATMLTGTVDINALTGATDNVDGVPYNIFEWAGYITDPSYDGSSSSTVIFEPNHGISYEDNELAGKLILFNVNDIPYTYYIISNTETTMVVAGDLILFYEYFSILDLQLPPHSPAIDAGTATNAPTLDLAGNSRIGAVDIGVYEWGYMDWDNDGILDIDDLDNDNDGVSDSDELTLYYTDPLNTDSDGDGLSDYTEIFDYLTDPNKEDTDEDGYSDSLEIQMGSNPLDINNVPPPNSELWVNTYRQSNGDGSQGSPFNNFESAENAIATGGRVNVAYGEIKAPYTFTKAIQLLYYAPY